MSQEPNGLLAVILHVLSFCAGSCEGYLAFGCAQCVFRVCVCWLRHNKKPRIEAQKKENLAIVFDFMRKTEKVPLVNIGESQVVECLRYGLDPFYSISTHAGNKLYFGTICRHLRTSIVLLALP